MFPIFLIFKEFFKSSLCNLSLRTIFQKTKEKTTNLRSPQQKRPKYNNELSHENNWPEKFQFDGFVFLTEQRYTFRARSDRTFTAYLMLARIKKRVPLSDGFSGLIVFNERVEIAKGGPNSPGRGSLILRYDPLCQDFGIYRRQRDSRIEYPRVAHFPIHDFIFPIVIRAWYARTNNPLKTMTIRWNNFNRGDFSSELIKQRYMLLLDGEEKNYLSTIFIVNATNRFFDTLYSRLRLR